jgi:hypothetical protein
MAYNDQLTRREFLKGETTGHAPRYGQSARAHRWRDRHGERDFESQTFVDYPGDQRYAWPDDKQGLFRGKGPRSYQRGDERILEDISDRLCENPHLDASDIEVVVREGEVTLSGSVPDRRSKWLAEDIGEEVSGVKNVENRLRVREVGR